MQPEICKQCGTQDFRSLGMDDGGGDYGDSVCEQWECTNCGHITETDCFGSGEEVFDDPYPAPANLELEAREAVDTLLELDAIWDIPEMFRDIDAEGNDTGKHADGTRFSEVRDILEEWAATTPDDDLPKDWQAARRMIERLLTKHLLYDEITDIMSFISQNAHPVSENPPSPDDIPF